MSDRQQRQTRAAQDAAAWLSRLESDDLSTDERGQFVDWLRESPTHVAEMLRVARLRNALAKFDKWDELPLSDAQAAGDRGNVLPLFTAQDVSQATEGRSGPKPRWLLPGVVERKQRMPVLAAVAATLAGLAILAAVFWPALGLGSKDIRTQLGERREMSLADGSEVALAPASEIRVSFDGKQRLVTVEHGEAFFHVSKDLNRPFLVDAGQARARALGTSFSVERRPDAVVVTVVEGRVAVGGGIALGANQQVTISGSGTAAPVRQIDGRVALAWSQGQLIFDNDTVAAVVARFNQYNQLKIRIADPTLGSRPVSGVFRATDPESFVAFLQSVAGVNTRKTGADEVIIEPSSTAPP